MNNVNKNLKPDGVTDDDEPAMNKDLFESLLERKVVMLSEAEGTGTDKSMEEMIFGRRSSISRTPPSRSVQCDRDVATCSESGDMPETVWQDDDQLTSPTFKLMGETTEQEMDTATASSQGKTEVPQDDRDREENYKALKKRKRNTPPPKGKIVKLGTNGEWEQVRIMITKVLNRTRELKKLVNESTKTKVEIKQVTRELACLVETMDKNAKAYEDNRDPPMEKTPRIKVDKSTQTVSMCSSVGIQTEASNIDIEERRAKDKKRSEIQEALRTGDGFAGIEKFLDETWPQGIYTKTGIETLNTTNMTSEGDLALLLNPKNLEGEKKIENLMLVHPDIKDFSTKNIGQIDYAIKTVATKKKGQETKEKTTVLYFLPIDINRDGVNNIEEVYNIITDLLNTMQVHPTDRLKLFVSEGLKYWLCKKNL